MRRLVGGILAAVLALSLALAGTTPVSAARPWEHPMNQFNHYIGDQDQADQFCRAVLEWSKDAYPGQDFEAADGTVVDPERVWWAWGHLGQQRCYWNQ